MTLKEIIKELEDRINEVCYDDWDNGHSYACRNVLKQLKEHIEESKE